jgi:RNA recognition motif-containing protein
MKIRIGNLPPSVSEAGLKALFEEYGQVSAVRIVTDLESTRPRGFGFVEMADEAEAGRAIAALMDRWVDGRTHAARGGGLIASAM